MDGVCDRIDCENAAALAPVIEVKAIDHPGTALIVVTVEVCVDHADTPIEAFIEGDRWEPIEAMFAAKGLIPPDRASAVLHWQPLPFRSVHSRRLDA